MQMYMFGGSKFLLAPVQTHTHWHRITSTIHDGSFRVLNPYEHVHFFGGVQISSGASTNPFYLEILFCFPFHEK